MVCLGLELVGSLVELGFSAGYHTADLYYDKNSLRWSVPFLLEETDEEITWEKSTVRNTA